MRRFLCLALAALFSAAAVAVDYPPVEAGRALVFPRDFGSHAEHRIEWWYITGWLKDKAGQDLGFQITFFRNRPGVAEANASAFAAKQLLFAHAALADPALGRLRHVQRSAREGLGLAQASMKDTDVFIGDWSLRRSGAGYVARLGGEEFRLDLSFVETQAVMPQGDGGYSRKGPDARQASYYYSQPQLKVTGRVKVNGAEREVTGSAWLDHEWSSELMAPEAVGWDWTGINFDDGSALMAFRMRDRKGGTVWAGGSYRSSTGFVRVFSPGEVKFEPTQYWVSPRTGTRYPVGMKVSAGALALELTPLFPDQELDARASTGTVYWEGAVRALRDGREAGRGYLELTGYSRPLKL